MENTLLHDALVYWGENNGCEVCTTRTHGALCFRSTQCGPCSAVKVFIALLL